MPRKAPKVCSTPGCPELTRTTHCPTHTPEPWAGSDRGKRLPRGWHTRIRPQILRRDPTCTCRGCRRCTPQGCDRPSTQVDHIQRGDNHNHSNLAGLCDSCHATKSGREGQASRVG